MASIVNPPEPPAAPEPKPKPAMRTPKPAPAEKPRRTLESNGQTYVLTNGGWRREEGN